MEMLVNIDVDDLAKAVVFYRDALALHEERRLSGGSVVEMTGASSKIHLLRKAPGSAALSNAPVYRTYRRHWTPVHLDFLVADIEAAVNRAVSAHAKLEGEIQAFNWGRLATLSDPFGHGFCLIQFVGKGYDEIA
ncbi:MAG TPA: VOC family protein [Candidatus Binatia bacterium]|jgi:predicted enzyme related to lactoylglutathione lyase